MEAGDEHAERARANVLQKHIECTPVVNKSTCICVLHVEKMFSVQMN